MGTTQILILLTQALSAANELMTVGQRATALLEKTRAEGREPTDAELAALMDETDVKHDETIALLRRAARA